MIIYNDDAWEVLKHIPDNSVDLIVTDLPYEVSATNGGGTINKVKKMNVSLKQLDDANITDGYEIEKYGEEFLRIMKEINIYLWCNKVQIPRYFDFYVNKHKCKFDIITWHKCLHSSTTIAIKDENDVVHLTPLKDLYRNDCKRGNIKKKRVFDGFKWTPIVNIVPKYDVEKYYVIKLRNGNEIKCTNEHRFSVNGILMQAEELEKGVVLDHTVIPLNTDVQITGLTEEVFWLIGHFLAEGNYRSRESEIGISTNKTKEWIANKIKIICQQYDASYSIYDEYGSENSRIIIIRSAIIKSIIKEYVTGKNSYTKHLTSKAYKLDQKNLDHILQGYLDGDGCYDSINDRYRLAFTIKNYNLFKDLSFICCALKYNFYFQKGKNTFNGKKYGCFRGSIRKNIRHTCKSPYEIVDIIVKPNTAKTVFYDLCLNNSNHLFSLYDGVLTHNSNALPTYSNKYLTDTEYLLYFRKGKGKCFPQSYEDAKTYYIAPINHKDKKIYNHPTIKPLDITEKIIRNSSRVGHLVLDPFMGSGTTGLAAKNMNREFIGIEIDSTYFRIAKERIGI